MKLSTNVLLVVSILMSMMLTFAGPNLSYGATNRCSTIFDLINTRTPRIKINGTEYFDSNLSASEIRLGRTLVALYRGNPNVASVSNQIYQSNRQGNYVSEYLEAFQRLTPEEIRAIKAYTMIGGQQMNSGLRSDQPLTDFNSRYSSDLKSALKKLPDYDGIVVRGAELPSEMIQQMIPGTLMREASFISASPDRGSRYLNRNVNFIIRSHSGKEVTYISAFPDRGGEVLFSSNSIFKVLYVDTRSGSTLVVLEQISL